MDSFKAISIIFVIIFFTILYNILFTPREIFCEGDRGDVVGFLSGKYAVLLGSVDEKSMKCVSEKWGMNTEKIQLLLLSDNDSALYQNKCMIKNTGKPDILLTKIWKNLCEAKRVKYLKHQILKYTFSNNQMKVSTNPNDSHNYTHVILEDSSKRSKQIYIYDYDASPIYTKKYKSDSTTVLLVDEKGFLNKMRVN